MSGFFDQIAAAVEGMFETDSAFIPYIDKRGQKRRKQIGEDLSGDRVTVEPWTTPSTSGGASPAGRAAPALVATGVRVLAGGVGDARSIESIAPQGPSLRSVMPQASGPIGANTVYAELLRMPVTHDEDDEQWRKRSGGGGGGGGHGLQLAGSRTATKSRPAPSPAQGMASRAAIAAGAQPAVFKVISTASDRQSAGALMQYLGTREGEDGKKHDIDIYTNDGRTLNNQIDRTEELTEWTRDFREPFQTSNFIEAAVIIDPATDHGDLHAALHAAFGSMPFVYALDGETVKVFACTDIKAPVLAKALSRVDDTSGRGGVLRKADAGIEEALKSAGVAARAEVTNAYSRGDYFLQKFIRANPQLVTSEGDDLNASRRPDQKALKLLSSWKSEFRTIEPRNVYHLLFSGRSGTDPVALVEAAKAVLSEKIPDHRWVLAHHPETRHVHVHAMVLSRSELGGTFRLSRPELYEWREAFAEKARANGIEMVATSRMDFAATRPYTMQQAGAYERAQRDASYSVSPAIINRVSSKRAALIDPRTANQNGAQIIAGWSASAEALEMSFPASQHLLSVVGRANAFSSVVKQFMSSQRRIEKEESGEKPAPETPPSAPPNQLAANPSLFKQVDQLMNAPRTPLEMREAIAKVSRSFAEAARLMQTSESLKKLDAIKDQVMDIMNERLNEIRVDYANAAYAAKTGNKPAEAPDQASPARQQPEKSPKPDKTEEHVKTDRGNARRSRDDDWER